MHNIFEQDLPRTDANFSAFTPHTVTDAGAFRASVAAATSI